MLIEGAGVDWMSSRESERTRVRFIKHYKIFESNINPVMVRKTFKSDPNWGYGGSLRFFLSRRPRLEKTLIPMHPKRREAEDVGFLF